MNKSNCTWSLKNSVKLDIFLTHIYSIIFKVQLFQVPAFQGISFFGVQVFQGQGFRNSRYVKLMNNFDKTFVLAFYTSFLKIELNCDRKNVLISNKTSIQIVFKRGCCLT